MPEWTLRGRTFLITGGARGIGAATARDVRPRGPRLALVDLDAGALAPPCTRRWPSGR
jgi:NAD(P)-dependent dehydrogenase (short-subunit alcohol dehydrogenase family)